MADTITIDSRGTLQRTLATLGDAPKGVERARKRAIRKLLTWVKRQVLRATAAASGMSQKAFGALLRFRASERGDGVISIWIGTNPVAAHYLGTVRWTRKMKGARVGKRSFPGSWSWGGESKLGTRVMRRIGTKRLPIEVVKVEIHEAVLARVQALVPDISERFETLMSQELRYALQVEAAR